MSTLLVHPSSVTSRVITVESRSSEATADRLLLTFGTPSEDLFRRLAATDPRALVSWVASGRLSPAKLTFAAEILGSVDDPALAVPPLLALMRHPFAVVREGAVYGLARFTERDAVSRCLRDAALGDPSAGVREAAAEALEEA